MPWMIMNWTNKRPGICAGASACSRPFPPQAAKFEGQMLGWPSIHVPISYFGMSVSQLEKQLAEKIQFHGKKN